MSGNKKLKLSLIRKHVDLRKTLLSVLVVISIVFTAFSWLGLLLLYTGFASFLSMHELAGGLVVESIGSLYTFGLGVVLLRLIQSDETTNNQPPTDEIMQELKQLRTDLLRIESKIQQPGIPVDSTASVGNAT